MDHPQFLWATCPSASSPSKFLSCLCSSKPAFCQFEAYHSVPSSKASNQLSCSTFRYWKVLQGPLEHSLLAGQLFHSFFMGEVPHPSEHLCGSSVLAPVGLYLSCAEIPRAGCRHLDGVLPRQSRGAEPTTLTCWSCF